VSSRCDCDFQFLLPFWPVNEAAAKWVAWGASAYWKLGRLLPTGFSNGGSDGYQAGGCGGLQETESTLWERAKGHGQPDRPVTLKLTFRLIFDFISEVNR